jgi:hypothetical protein
LRKDTAKEILTSWLVSIYEKSSRGQIEQLKQYKNKGDFTKGHMYEVNIDATADDFWIGTSH